MGSHQLEKVFPIKVVLALKTTYQWTPDGPKAPCDFDLLTTRTHGRSAPARRCGTGSSQTLDFTVDIFEVRRVLRSRHLGLHDEDQVAVIFVMPFI